MILSTDALAHADALGSVSLHPLRPYLLTVSGSRTWSNAGDESGDDDANLTSPRSWHAKEAHLSIWEASQ